MHTLGLSSCSNLGHRVECLRLAEREFLWILVCYVVHFPDAEIPVQKSTFVSQLLGSSGIITEDTWTHKNGLLSSVTSDSAYYISERTSH